MAGLFIHILAMIIGLDEKAIKRSERELLLLHKECVRTYLIQRKVRTSVQNKFWILYHLYIHDSNIHQYFFRPIRTFVYALVTDRLSEIEDYMPVKIKPKKKSKCTKRK